MRVNGSWANSAMNAVSIIYASMYIAKLAFRDANYYFRMLKL